MDGPDREILRLYVEQMERLTGTKVGSAGNTYDLTIGWKEGEPLTIDTRLPDDEELAAFLLAFRPMYLEGEATNFYRVASIVYRVLESKDPQHPLKEEMAKARHHFGTVLDKPSARIVYNDEVITPRKMIDLWFNAFYFHKDLSKREDFERLRKGLGNLFQFFFMDAIFDLAKCVVWLGNVARRLLSEDEPKQGTAS